MGHLIKIVDSLESRISKLLAKHSNLVKVNAKLEEEVIVLRAQQEEFQKEIESWSDKCNSLKLANSMLGSDQHKRETKLKINALVREIDQCITQLAE